MPFFSVIVPVYNHERYIGSALDTLLAQTDGDWEAVVVNDGSTDGTPAIIESYARRDTRIRIIHKANGGQPTALNAGLREARGTWICWLSSDDLFESGKLAVHRVWINRHPTTRFFFTEWRTLHDVSGRVSDFDDSGLVPHEAYLQVLTLLTFNYINGISICVHREVFESVGLFNEVYRYAQDYDFHLRALCRFSARHIPERTCISRTHGTQFSALHNAVMFYECARVGIEFVNRTPLTDMLGTGMADDPDTVLAVVDRALDVVLTRDALIYRLGDHSALMARVLEQVLSMPNDGVRKRLLAHVLARVRMGFVALRGSGWAVLCRAAAIAVEEQYPASYRPVVASAVAAVRYRSLIRDNYEEALALREFAERFLGWTCGGISGAAGGDRAPFPVGATGLSDSMEGLLEVLLVGDRDDEAQGRLRQEARIYADTGGRVLRLVIGENGLGFDEGGYVLGVKDGFGLALALCGLPPPDRLGAPRRFRVTRWPVGGRQGCRPVGRAMRGVLSRTSRVRRLLRRLGV